MLVNLSYSYIPLQKISQKGVDRSVENPQKRAENIKMAPNAPNKFSWRMRNKMPLCSKASEATSFPESSRPLSREEERGPWERGCIVSLTSSPLFVLVSSLIGYENSHYLVHQSNAMRKTTLARTTWDFSAVYP